MNITIVDPGLIAKAGHHLDIDQKIINVLSEGNNLKVLAPKVCEPQVINILERSSVVIPKITHIAYSDIDDTSTAEDEFDHFTATSKDLTDLLVDISKQTDFFIFPTLFPAQLHACAAAKIKVPIAGCIQLNSNFQSIHIGDALWKIAYEAAKDAGLKINIGAFENVHLGDYQSIFNLRVNLFSVPYGGKPSNEPGSILKTIGILGHQRQEKGASIFDLLVGSLIRDGYSIIVQDSACQIKAKHPSIKDFGFVEDLGELIRECDLIILPYLADRYRVRGSGILWEAIANGVPILCPAETALSKNLEDLGIGSTFQVLGADSIANKVRECGKNYPYLSSQANKVAHKWGDNNGVIKFIESLTNPNNFGTLL